MSDGITNADANSNSENQAEAEQAKYSGRPPGEEPLTVAADDDVVEVDQSTTGVRDADDNAPVVGEDEVDGGPTPARGSVPISTEVVPASWEPVDDAPTRGPNYAPGARTYKRVTDGPASTGATKPRPDQSPKPMPKPATKVDPIRSLLRAPKTYVKWIVKGPERSGGFGSGPVGRLTRFTLGATSAGLAFSIFVGENVPLRVLNLARTLVGAEPIRINDDQAELGAAPFASAALPDEVIPRTVLPPRPLPTDLPEVGRTRSIGIESPGRYLS